MPCKHAALAAIYAKQMAEMDEPWKFWEFNNSNYGWQKLEDHPRWVEKHQYRQIPKTIRIGNCDVPEPMREKPEIGTTYWAVSAMAEDGAVRSTWHGDSYDLSRLAKGQCHLTRDNCIAHAKALFSFSEVG